MKKLIPLVLTMALISPASFSAQFSVKCLTEKGSFSSCKLDTADEQLVVTQGKERTIISSNQVALLRSTSYREENMTKDMMAVGTVGLFGAARNLLRKRVEHLNIVYGDLSSNSRRSLFIEVPEKKAPVIKQVIETAMGKLFETSL